MGTTMGHIHEAFHQLWTFHHLLRYLRCLHRHHRRKLHAALHSLHRKRYRCSRRYRNAFDPADLTLVGAKSEISRALLIGRQRLHGRRSAYHILLPDPGHASDQRSTTAHITAEAAAILWNRNLRDGGDRRGDAIGELDEDSTALHRHLRCAEPGNVWRHSRVHLARLFGIRQVRRRSFGIDHLELTDRRDSGSNREDSDCSRGVLHIWTSVLRLPRDRMGCAQDTLHQATIVGQLHDAHHPRYIGCAAGCRCANHRTIRRHSRCLLLLDSRLDRSRVHRNGDVLGARLRQIQLDHLEERNHRRFRLLGTLLRIEIINRGHR